MDTSYWETQYQKGKLLKLIEIHDTIKDFLNHEDQDVFLQKIAKEFQTYINDNCEHHWVEDTIDVDVEKTINIKYCSVCSLTMS